MINRNNMNKVQSNICVSLLCKLVEFVSVKNNEIYIRNENLIINKKKMLIYNIEGIRKRRKNKNDYDYFNPYQNEDHFKFLINFIIEVEDLDSLCIEDDYISLYFLDDTKVILNLDKNIENKKERIIETLLHVLDV